MLEIKYHTKPGVAGAFACALLTVSYFIGFENHPIINSIMKISAILLCVQLIRSTAALYSCKVRKIPSLITLILMPLFSLIIIILSFFSGNRNPVISLIVDFFANTLVGTVIVVAFSLPLYFLYYFIYLVRKFRNDGVIKIITIILAVSSVFYVVLQLDNMGIIPMLERLNIPIPELYEKFMSYSYVPALIIYIIAFVGFIIYQKLISNPPSEE